MYRDQKIVAILVAAGQSTRMGFDKLFYPVSGVEILRLALEKLDGHPYIDSLVVVAGENIERVKKLLKTYPPRKSCAIVRGGTTRTASVAAGLKACEDVPLVAIHDAARPFVSQQVISQTVEAAVETGAAAPAIPMKDTIKQVRDGFVSVTPPRSHLMAVQTPQVFRRYEFEQALAMIPQEDYPQLTDDCMVMELTGNPVQLVPGDAMNKKITTVEDLPKEENRILLPRVGHGYDVHALLYGRKLVLGGVEIPYEKGLQGHSDADVLLHAIADALLGAAALGDVGRHFPDSDPIYKDASSLVLLERVAKLLLAEGYVAFNIDATILCESPRLATHIPAMRRNIARAVNIEEGAVSVKATTEEGLGFTGRNEGIAAHCVVMIKDLRELSC